MGPAQASRLISHGFHWRVIPMGENFIWHKIFSVGESFIMTGIAHFFVVLAPDRLQFHSSFFHLGRCAQSSNCYGHAAALMGINEFCGS